jgi:hypothetical protein
MNLSRIRKRILVCLVLLSTVTFPFALALADDQKPAEEQKAPEETPPSATLSTDILSQYIFRGAAQSKDSAVIQPSFTGTYAGFSVNVWGNLDTARHSNNPYMVMPSGQSGNAKFSEGDVTVSYTKEIFKDFSVLLGNVYYDLQVPISAYPQDEVFGGISYNFPWFTAAFTTYGEVSHYYDVWFELDLTKSFPVDFLCKGATFDVGASFGYLILLRNDVSDRQVRNDRPEDRCLAAFDKRRLELPGCQFPGLRLDTCVRRSECNRYVLRGT